MEKNKDIRCRTDSRVSTPWLVAQGDRLHDLMTQNSVSYEIILQRTIFFLLKYVGNSTIICLIFSAFLTSDVAIIFSSYTLVLLNI